MRLLITIAALFITSVASALTLQTQSYDTLEQAAVVALHQTYGLSDTFEGGGLIYRSQFNHKYYISEPVVSTSSHHVTLPMTEKLPGFGWAVADYHTHPCHPNYFSQYFSPDDTKGYKAWHDVGFMADLCTGKVHEFDPKRDRFVTTHLNGFDDDDKPVRVGATEGRIIGQFSVIAPRPRDIWEGIDKVERESRHSDRSRERPEREEFQQYQDSDPHPPLDTHDWPDLHTAAEFGLREAARVTQSYEAGGIILRNKKTGLYRVTVPYTQYNYGRVFLPMNDHDFDADYVLAGLYHTHPCAVGYIHGYFSAPDAAAAMYKRVPGFMLNLCSGNWYMFDPLIDQPDNHVVEDDVNGRHLKWILTSGRMVGWFDLTIKP